MEQLPESRTLQERKAARPCSEGSDLLLRPEIDFTSGTFGDVLSSCFFASSAAAMNKFRRSRWYNDAATCFYLFVIIAAILLSCTSAAVTTRRIPNYQDVEAAVESARCEVRDVVMNIRDIHPTLPPNMKLMPSCVLLRRCSGCCNNDRHKCMPTEIYNTQIEISRRKTVGRRTMVDYIALNFTHHAQCACFSPVNPTCVPTVCGSEERWNTDLCRCEPRCQREECQTGQRWNTKECRCECSRCHPEHTVHLRFDQNSTTCICACRNAYHGRRMCARRRVEYDTSICSCVPPRSLHRRRSQHD